MRTTLTLDEDVAAQLQRLRKSRQTGLKALVNEALRRGLRQMTTEQKPAPKYGTREVSLWRCLVGSIDDVAEVLAVAGKKDFR
jgi:hypothetical protein